MPEGKVDFPAFRAITALPALFNAYIPVSYTHLDVYKRQLSPLTHPHTISLELIN